jgi:enoyl-CoA hydratase
MSDNVLLDRDDPVATITVNRPEKRNAMDVPTRKSLRSVFEDVADVNAVRVVILRGAGDGSFIAGGDIEAFAEFGGVEGLEYVTEHAQGLYNLVAEMPKPTVAAVDGHAYGGGTEIALACDIRLATEDARFGLPEVGLGILPAGGGTQRLAHVVGAGIAKELVMTGRTVDSAEARDIGLVNNVHPADEFDDQVEELARTLASKAPLAQRLAKEAIDNGLDIDSGLSFERVAGAFLFGTDDSAEGVSAFLNDQDPEFRGQ